MSDQYSYAFENCQAKNRGVVLKSAQLRATCSPSRITVGSEKGGLAHSEAVWLGDRRVSLCASPRMGEPLRSAKDAHLIATPNPTSTVPGPTVVSLGVQV